MIPYLGQKSKYANFIIPSIPDEIDNYVEPFGGGFGIYFSLDLDKYKNTTFVYNDINYLNYNLFRHLKSESFLSYFSSVKMDEKFYNLAKSMIYNCSDLEKAIYWLTILTCSVSQIDILNGTWKGDFEFEILKMKVKQDKSYLDRINSVNNIDYKEIIAKYDSPDSFFYIDPPYFKKESYYINHNFYGDSHIELSEYLKNIKGKFALSYLYFPMLDDWYSDCKFQYFNSFMGTETLITNY